jgi:hypothetical protein
MAGSPPTPVTLGQAVRIAHADAQSAYRDLSPYRIRLALEADGLHVDYELKNPNWNGGGPHYIIDVESGAVVKKRYEQ